MYIRLSRSIKVRSHQSFCILARRPQPRLRICSSTRERYSLQDNKLSLDKLVGITFDGASNMMGSNSGLTTRYLELQPQLWE